MSGVSELWIIEAKFWKPDISLKEINELWFKAKGIITDNINNLDNNDFEVSVNIFNKGVEKVGDFFIKWLDKEIQPTDEELNLLEEAFNEASWAFNFLAINAPNVFSPENSNEKWQEKIKENKKIISEEKAKREKIKDLQSQISSLQNKPSNSDNEAKIKDLQRQIEELKKNKPVPSPVPNPEVPRQSTSNNNNNNNSLIGIFCLGFGACLVLVLGYLVFLKKKKKKTSRNPWGVPLITETPFHLLAKKKNQKKKFSLTYGSPFNPSKSLEKQDKFSPPPQ